MSGLFTKYIVTKFGTEEVVSGCFVLRPKQDPAALKALDAYATAVAETNPLLANDLRGWVAHIEAEV